MEDQLPPPHRLLNSSPSQSTPQPLYFLCCINKPNPHEELGKIHQLWVPWIDCIPMVKFMSGILHGIYPFPSNDITNPFWCIFHALFPICLCSSRRSGWEREKRGKLSSQLQNKRRNQIINFINFTKFFFLQNKTIFVTNFI